MPPAPVLAAATHAIQIYGSRCMVEEELPEMILLGALAGTTAGGTEEIHRGVTYQQMLRRQARERRQTMRQMPVGDEAPSSAWRPTGILDRTRVEVPVGA